MFICLTLDNTDGDYYPAKRQKVTYSTSTLPFTTKDLGAPHQCKLQDNDVSTFIRGLGFMDCLVVHVLVHDQTWGQIHINIFILQILSSCKIQITNTKVFEI